MKPKLWDGANAVGEAKMRMLELIDAPYLTASGPGFVARKKGAFREVVGVVEKAEQEEPQFAAVGARVVDGEVVREVRATADFRKSFKKARGELYEYVGKRMTVGSIPDMTVFEGAEYPNRALTQCPGTYVAGHVNLGTTVVAQLYHRWWVASAPLFSATAPTVGAAVDVTTNAVRTADFRGSTPRWRFGAGAPQYGHADYNTHSLARLGTTDRDRRAVAALRAVDGAIPTVAASLATHPAAPGFVVPAHCAPAPGRFAIPCYSVGDAATGEFSALTPFPGVTDRAKPWMHPVMTAVGHSTVCAVLATGAVRPNTLDDFGNLPEMRVLYSRDSGATWTSMDVSDALLSGRMAEPPMAYAMPDDAFPSAALPESRAAPVPEDWEGPPGEHDGATSAQVVLDSAGQVMTFGPWHTGGAGAEVWGAVAPWMRTDLRSLASVLPGVSLSGLVEYRGFREPARAPGGAGIPAGATTEMQAAQIVRDATPLISRVIVEDEAYEYFGVLKERHGAGWDGQYQVWNNPAGSKALSTYDTSYMATVKYVQKHSDGSRTLETYGPYVTMQRDVRTLTPDPEHAGAVPPSPQRGVCDPVGGYARTEPEPIPMEYEWRLPYLDILMSDVGDTLRVFPLDRHEALVTFVFRTRAVREDYPESGAAGPSPAYLSPTAIGRIARISAQGVLSVADLPMYARGTRRMTSDVDVINHFVQYATYLGADAVLAKACRDGFSYHALSFCYLLSFNRGATWEEFVPQGLPTHTTSAVGDFCVVKAREGTDSPGLVLVPVSTDGACYAYYSRDCGRTWTQGGRIASSERFMRVDHVDCLDDGGNYERIVYFGTRARPAPRHPAIPEFEDDDV